MNKIILKFSLSNSARCCIYLMTYDRIKSFLKITIEGRAIYGNLEIRLIRFIGQWKIPFLKITITIYEYQINTKIVNAGYQETVTAKHVH